jgi:hypothetical protein
MKKIGRAYCASVVKSMKLGDKILFILAFDQDFANPIWPPKSKMATINKGIVKWSLDKGVGVGERGI